MINRVIIRSKVLQILYSAYRKESKDLKLMESELLFSFQKSYDLYHYLLLLIPHLTNLEEKRLDIRRRKHLATEEEKNPNTRFVNNRLASQLAENEMLRTFFNEKGSIWMEEEAFVKKLLDQIIESDIYKSYLTSPDNYNSDKDFWKQAFKTFIYNNEELDDLLEDSSIYWNDDVEIIETFVMKTIKRMEESSTESLELLPMFRYSDDREFAVRLLRETIINGDQQKDLVEAHVKNWEVDRLSGIDLYIMQLAITEMLTFDSIPLTVTLNEYLDLAKVFSTSKSAFFINGILDAVITDLRAQNRLLKLN